MPLSFDLKNGAGRPYLVVLEALMLGPLHTWPIPGDANQDCWVNILGLILVRNRLNQDVESEDNWQADVSQDGKINILDLILVRVGVGVDGHRSPQVTMAV
jgi:hypothetical protein